MLDDSFAHLKGQVQSRKIGIAVLELLHDVERMEVVVKALAVLVHGRIQSLLAGVAKRRVADIVSESQRLDIILIYFQFGSDGAGDLCDLNGVGQAIAKVI